MSRLNNTANKAITNSGIIVMSIVLSGILLNGCNCSNSNVKPQNAPAPEYSVVTLSPRQTTLFNYYPAVIQGQQNVEIRPMIDGYMKEIFVDEGATVKKGQPLFRINAPQYEQELLTAQADIKIAQADVNAAQMEVNKVRPLVEKDIISRYELESAEFSLQSKLATLAQAEARLANARTNLGYTLISSPVDGVMGIIPFKIGSLVSSTNTTPLTTVSNIVNIYAYLSVSERRSLDFSLRTKGATIEERLATLPPATLILSNGLEHPEKGRVETEVGIVDRQTGAVTVRVIFPNPRGLVRSGSSGTVRIPRTIDSALLIPQSATYELQGKRFVYVLENSGKVKSTEVTVLQSANGQFFVAEQGLQAGDKIVAGGVSSLYDGMAVKPRIINADSLYQTANQ